MLAPLTPVLNDEVAMPITPEPISNAPVTITNAGTVTSLVLQPISNHDGSSQFVMNAETTTPIVPEPITKDVATPGISDHEKENTNVIAWPKNTASCLLPLCVAETSSKNRSNAFVSTEVIRPYPKAGPRKGVTKGRKKGCTRILTDTPEKLAIESELDARKRKKEVKVRKVKAKLVKRNLYSQAQDETTSEDKEIPPSQPSDLSVSYETDSSSESENEEDTIVSVTSGDWVIVNMVSQRNLVHRYVGQVQSRSQTGYDIKFAKKNQ